MHPVELTERRINNAMEAMNRCKDGSWGHKYWGKVVAYLLRKMNGELNEKNVARGCSQTRNRTH